MLLLLLMYVAPLVAVALYWQAQRSAEGRAAWETLKAAAEGRAALVRPVAAAFLFVAALMTAALGVRGGVAFLAGAVLAAFAAALAYAAAEAALEGAIAASPASRWSESFAIALGPAAVATGCVGALAWFFADPAGVVVLAAFAAGASAGALCIALTMSAAESSGATSSNPDNAASTCRAVTMSATGALHLHLPAVAAALMVAATAEPEALLSLGGLLAETETLRSELVLLPIAISILSPVLALAAGPFVASLLDRRGLATLFDVDRFAAVLAGLGILALVMASGLAWVVGAAFAVGVAARQMAVVADEIASRSIGGHERSSPSLLPAALSAGALVCGEYLAGWYGVTLAALGMTATFASVAACATARELSAGPNTPAMPAADFNAADATASVTTTLALLVAVAPVLVAESARRGEALTMMATAAPALMLGVVAGAVCAAAFSDRYAQVGDEGETARRASRAVAIAAGAPALAGVLLGPGAAVGVALGFMAWAAASAPLAGGAGVPTSPRERMPRAVLLAWGRTMALAALVSVPIMR